MFIFFYLLTPNYFTKLITCLLSHESRRNVCSFYYDIKQKNILRCWNKTKNWIIECDQNSITTNKISSQA